MKEIEEFEKKEIEFMKGTGKFMNWNKSYTRARYKNYLITTRGNAIIRERDYEDSELSLDEQYAFLLMEKWGETYDWDGGKWPDGKK